MSVSGDSDDTVLKKKLELGNCFKYYFTGIINSLLYYYLLFTGIINFIAYCIQLTAQ